MLSKILFYLLELVVTYVVEVICFGIGWNFLLCMAWDSLPVMSYQQVLLTVLGLKFCKFSISQWYHGTKEK